MANLRQARSRVLRPDDLFGAGEVEAGPVGMMPGPELDGGIGDGLPDPSGNPMKPIELNPGQTPVRSNVPRGAREPTLKAGPVDSVGFAGGGATTASPPSVTQRQPMSLSSPDPGSMVRPSGRLFGKRGGQFGGGLGLSAEEGFQGSQDPSSLILNLLKLLGQ